MAKIVLQEQDSILTFPVDSILDLLIEEAVIKVVPSQRGDWEKLELKFKILGIQALGKPGPGESSNLADYDNWITQNIYGSVPWKLTNHPENKLRMWTEATLRMDLGPGFELDSDLFLRRRVRGLTDQYDTKSKDSSGNSFKRHQIAMLLPANDGGGTPLPQQQAAPAQQDPWGTPAPAQTPAWGAQQSTQAPPQQQAPAQQAQAPADPWAAAGGWGDDEPPF